MRKVRVWTKEEIQEAFEEYLLETKQVESDDWKRLSVDDIQCLRDRHFEIFFKELKRWSEKRVV